MEEKKINKSIAFSIVAAFILAIIVLGATYAYFRAAGQTDVQEITTANLKMNFVAGEWVRADEKMMPISDAEINTKAVELPFTITNTGDEHMNVTIKLTDITMSEELKDVDFRWGLFNAETGNGLSYGIFSDIGDATEVTIYRDTIIDAADPDITNSYVLRIWIHDDGAAQDSLMGRSFSARVKATGEAVKYTDESCFTFDSGIITAYNETCPKDIVIPRTIGGVTVTTIAVNTFGTTNPTSVIIPNTITGIGNGAFQNSSIKHITIPEGVTTIGSNIFYNNTNITSVIMPSTITTMTLKVFNGIKLSTLIISSNFTARNALFNNAGLENAIIMDGVTRLYAMFFSNNNLTSVEIPSSVMTVDCGAFMDNPNLEEIIIRGKENLEQFTDHCGLNYSTAEGDGGLNQNVKIEFRP